MFISKDARHTQFYSTQKKSWIELVRQGALWDFSSIVLQIIKKI